VAPSIGKLGVLGPEAGRLAEVPQILINAGSRPRTKTFLDELGVDVGGVSRSFV